MCDLVGRQASVAPVSGARFIRLAMQPYAIVGFSMAQQHRMLVSPFAEAVINLVCSAILVFKPGARWAHR